MSRGFSHSLGQEQTGGEPALKAEELRALAINQLAGVFSDVKLIRVLTIDELARLGEEESRDSYTDLTRFQEAHKNRAKPASIGSPSTWLPRALRPKPAASFGEGMRNHALLSKAKRALDIAEWSLRAQEDFELYQLTDTEGLTPILDVLTDLERDSGAKPAAAPVAEKATT